MQKIIYIEPNTEIIDKEIPDFDLIDKKGSYFWEDQWMTINYRGKQIDINFDLELDVTVEGDKGDSYTPPFYQNHYKNIKVFINSVEYDGEILSFDKKTLEHFVLNSLGI